MARARINRRRTTNRNQRTQINPRQNPRLGPGQHSHGQTGPATYGPGHIHGIRTGGSHSVPNSQHSHRTFPLTSGSFADGHDHVTPDHHFGHGEHGGYNQGNHAHQVGHSLQGQFTHTHTTGSSAYTGGQHSHGAGPIARRGGRVKPKRRMARGGRTRPIVSKKRSRVRKYPHGGMHRGRNRLKNTSQSTMIDLCIQEPNHPKCQDQRWGTNGAGTRRKGGIARRNQRQRAGRIMQTGGYVGSKGCRMLTSKYDCDAQSSCTWSFDDNCCH
tara:strand:- start:7297 stop:8109 length:813 start_codon:yes stop_codon:yes gene_type:complete